MGCHVKDIPTNCLNKSSDKTRPLLEYCAPVWSPHLVTQILAVEMVQRRAARFVKANFQWTASVTEMLRSLNWETLRSRGENLRLG